MCVNCCICTQTTFSAQLPYVSEVLEELVAYSLVLDACCVVLMVVALHREVPVEVAGQLRATTCTGHEEASQVGELGGREKFIISRGIHAHK